MAKYNTFVVIDTKTRNPVLVTSSARKATAMLTTGIRVEVWSENQKALTLYTRTASALDLYIEQERAYIQAKQAMAEQRNKQRRASHGYTARQTA